MFRNRSRHEVPSLNTTSTADISFMLLVFFLVTSSMDADKGLQRQLPPPPQEQEQPIDIKQSDMLVVSLDAADRLTCNGDTLSLDQLKKRVTEFVSVNPAQRLVVIETDRKTSYGAYFQMQNAIVAAYKPLKCPPRISEITEEGREP